MNVRRGLEIRSRSKRVLPGAEKCKEPSEGITVDAKQTHRERNSTEGSTPSGSVSDISLNGESSPGKWDVLEINLNTSHGEYQK